jgi:CheY-like chemotaxis protein
MEPVILLIEDSEADILLLQQAFTKAGLNKRLNVVRDGVEAMSYLLGRGACSDRDKYLQPNILLLDLNMPRLNGLELVTWLRTQPDFAHLMVVVLSSTARPEQIDYAYQMGAKSFLVKPADAKELQNLISCFYLYWGVYNHFPASPVCT